MSWCVYPRVSTSGSSGIHARKGVNSGITTHDAKRTKTEVKLSQCELIVFLLYWCNNFGVY